MGMEHSHESCGSICNKPLFYLTKDISEGMPESECINEQLKLSQALAMNISSISGILSYIMYGTIAFIIPIFRDYHKLEDHEFAEHRLKK